MAQWLHLAVLLTSSIQQVDCFRMKDKTRGDTKLIANASMLNDDPYGHVTCPVLNAFVQNGDLKTIGKNADADTVVNSLMRAGLNQPAYGGDPLPAGITQSNAFEYTFGIFLKNKAANYKDKDGDLTLPIYSFPGTNHEHNSHTGITTKRDVPFDIDLWNAMATKADRKLPNGGSCFSRDAWAQTLLSFEQKTYDGTATREINNDKVRDGHPILGPAGSWGGSWLVSKLLKHGANNGNEVGGKRLVAGVSQVFNGMINLFWTGDYGNLDLYKARARQAKTAEGKAGLSFPWLDADFCLPVDELRELLMHGTYPKSSGYAAMTEQEFLEKGKVWKFPKSRCTAEYFQEGHEGFEAEDACIDGEPPLVNKESWVKLKAMHIMFGK